MAARTRRVLFEPRIREHLLREEGEDVVDEVRHHWVVYIGPALEGALAFGVFLVFLVTPVGIAWLPFAVSLLVGAHAGYRALEFHMDRFVVTNMRVFRISGVFSQRLSTMPLRKILDITLDKPVVGRMLGYGHITFQSAAEEQGLRQIKHIGDPDERDKMIQRVVQRAGLRGPKAK